MICSMIVLRATVYTLHNRYWIIRSTYIASFVRSFISCKNVSLMCIICYIQAWILRIKSFSHFFCTPRSLTQKKSFSISGVYACKGVLQHWWAAFQRWTRSFFIHARHRNGKCTWCYHQITSSHRKICTSALVLCATLDYAERSDLCYE